MPEYRQEFLTFIDTSDYSKALKSRKKKKNFNKSSPKKKNIFIIAINSKPNSSQSIPKMNHAPSPKLN